VYGYFVDASTKLDQQSVPDIGRYAIVDPATYALLLKSPDFIRSTAMGDSIVSTGRVGQIAGFTIYKSNNVPLASSAKYILCGEQDAIFYAGQIMSVEQLRLETSFDSVVRGLLLHDSKVVAENSKRLAYIKAAA
jgi:hypothetical protein